MSSRTYFEIRNSKSSELGPQAAEQIFSSLPKTKKPLFRSPSPITFEIFCANQVITFYFSCPTPQADYLKSQITAAYPESLITPLENNHYLSPLFQGHLKSATLNLQNFSYLPLKTYPDFPDTDPFSSILGTLSKLQPGQSALRLPLFGL